jgi:hypothetical protein
MVTKTFTSDVKNGKFFYIRFSGGSKTFYVKKYVTVSKASAAAESFIKDYYLLHPEEKPSFYRFLKKPTKRNKSGFIGVYRTSYMTRGNLHGYWCANIPVTDSGAHNISRRFCVETYGEKKAKSLAVRYRKEWEMKAEAEILL